VRENAEILTVTSGVLYIYIYIYWRLQLKGLHIEKYWSINLSFSTEFPNILQSEFKSTHMYTRIFFPKLLHCNCIVLLSTNFALLHSDIHSDPIFHLFLAKMVFRPMFNYGFPICKDATSITGIILWNWIPLQRSAAVWIFKAFL
jgi:hypothetical protein